MRYCSRNATGKLPLISDHEKLPFLRRLSKFNQNVIIGILKNFIRIHVESPPVLVLEIGKFAIETTEASNFSRDFNPTQLVQRTHVNPEENLAHSKSEAWD